MKRDFRQNKKNMIKAQNGARSHALTHSSGTSGRLVHGSGLIRWNGSERPHSCLALSSWNTKGWWIRRTSRLVGCCLLRYKSRLCFGWNVFYHGQAKEVAAGIQRVDQVRCYRPATTPRTGSVVEPSGFSPAYSQDNPLSSIVRAQVIGKWGSLWHLLC